MLISKKVRVYNGVEEEKIKKTAQEAGISKLLSKVFLSRGIDDAKYIERFLKPSMADIHDPFLMSGMKNAVKRIGKALENNEKIIIYGDYDVDGITSTYILYDFLNSLKADISYYIPDRIKDGYGLGKSALEKVISKDCSLIITVDCGTTAIKEVEFVLENNVDIIVTDHHECKDVLPKATAVINPCRSDCKYPFKKLAGVGVVYKLINAFCIEMGLGDRYSKYLEFVSLGTIADVVPLIDENRILVKYGLKKMKNTTNLGLKTLINNSGLKGKPIVSWAVAFILAPRINAAGRIGDASRAIELFSSEDPDKTLNIVLQLNKENRYRQKTETEILNEAIGIIESRLSFKKEKVLVVYGKGWHHGVIGIVASRITERYNKPSIVISADDGIGKGSGRSIEAFNLYKALEFCSDVLDRYGGHELAAGLMLEEERIEQLQRKINEYADSVLDEYDLIPKISIDVKIDKEDISMESVRELQLLAPFGTGNPSPVFEYSNLKVDDIRRVGKNKHLKIKFRDGKLRADAIGFNMGSIMENISKSSLFDVVCSLEINNWNNIDRVQLKLKDMRLNDDLILEYGFYKTLENYLDLEDLNKQDIEIAEVKSILEKAVGLSNEGKKTAIVTNSLVNARQIKNLLKKEFAGIKNRLKICYTCFNVFFINRIYVMVNPDPEFVDFSNYGFVIFYGDWMGRSYLKKLMQKCDKDKIILAKSSKGIAPVIDNIIPVREDLEAVYRHLKATGSKTVFIKNLYWFADEIVKCYRVDMNYFKLKKCMEIFKELGLLTIRNTEGFSFELCMIDNIKVNLDDSSIYRRLHKIREYMEGFSNGFKE